MALRVPEHLAFCLAPGGVMFLDRRRDRYFGLPRDLDEAFSTLVGNAFQGLADAAMITRLEALGVIEDGPVLIERAQMPALTSSLPDQMPSASRQATFLELFAVASAVFQARQRLRRYPLNDVLAGLTDPIRPVDNTLGLLAKTGVFARARHLVPIRPVCLLDSVALRIFLSRYHHRPALVFGVVREPFAAHCWLQHDKMVLNDHLDHARQHTPILVIP